MNKITTLMLAGFAALSLGAGMASAQSLTPSAGESGFFAGQNNAAVSRPGARADQRDTMQYGSSDHIGRTVVRSFDSDQTDGGF